MNVTRPPSRRLFQHRSAKGTVFLRQKLFWILSEDTRTVNLLSQPSQAVGGRDDTRSAAPQLSISCLLAGIYLKVNFLLA